MEDKTLKDMWYNDVVIPGSSEYTDRAIQRFISGRSRSVSDKVRTLIRFDVFMKIMLGIALAVNALLYFQIQNIVSIVCILELLVLISLIRFEFGGLSQFNKLSEFNQPARHKIIGMLSFLKTRFFSIVLAISSSYLFLFTAGMLFYFYIKYGQLRPLDEMDVFVFSIICLAGMAINFVSHQSLVRFQAQHLASCLAELNDGSLDALTRAVKKKQKQDRLINILIALILIIGLLVFIAIGRSMWL